MTVEELIEKLSILPQNMKVVFWNEEDNPVCEIERKGKKFLIQVKADATPQVVKLNGEKVIVI